MKRVIFTLYDEVQQSLDQQKLDNVNEKLTLEYFDRLIQNKKDYAESIGVEFKFFHNTMSDYMEELVASDELDFTVVNLYKHHLFAKLAEEYDEVMYVDVDVVFNTDENIFDELDLSKGIHVKDQDEDIQTKDINKIFWRKIGLRNPTLKYHITKDLLDGKDNHVINTGLMIGKSQHIKQIKFLDRLPEAIAKIKTIKANIEKGNAIKTCYYPNNESIFSYILEKYNVPYALMDKEWHFIYDYKAYDKGLHGKILHFVNKKFVRFFKDKTKVIFSLYVKIEDDLLDSPRGPKDDHLNKSKRTQIQLEKYFDALQKDKQEYADSIGADYVLFENDSQYKTFRKDYPDLSEYDIVNLYKVYCLDLLSKKYDHVLYLDFDVVCRKKDVDIFEHIPLEYSMGCNNADSQEVGIKYTEEYFKKYQRDFRSPESKYWNAHAMFVEDEIEPDHVVFNTGIMAASKYVMNKLDYFNDMSNVIELMKELKEDEFSMYPEEIRKSFGYDNETIMSYKIKKNNVSVSDLWEIWHFKHYCNYVEGYDKLNDKSSRRAWLAMHEYNHFMKSSDPIFVHFISKQFGLYFDK